MALRNVTLTGTTIGTGISTVDIYHSYVDPNNLIASGVTSSELSTGYTFQDQDYRWQYVCVSDGACGTSTNVMLPNAPITTWIESQVVDIANITIANDITGIASVENDFMLIANQTLTGYANNQFIVRSDTNGSTWVKEIYASSTRHQAPTHNDIVGLKTTSGLILWAGHAENTSTDDYLNNSRSVWSSDGGDTWEDVTTLSQGTSGGAYSPLVGFFQDKQSKLNSSSTRRDAKDYYVGFLGQYFNTGTAHQSHSFAFWNGTNDFASFNVSDVPTFNNYMTSSTIYKNNTTVGSNYNLGGIKSYDTRLTFAQATNANFVQISGHVNGYLIRATNNSTSTIDSGGSGTNFNITAVGHNQEIISTTAATWLAAVINPNQDSNTQQFIISYDDGITWEDYVGTNMDTSRINDIAYVNGRWYAVGVGSDGTTGRICSTADLNDPWDQVSTTKPCLSIGIGDIVQNTKIIVGCEGGYIVQNQI